MNKEIKIITLGDYVRTKKGIAKIIGQNDEVRFSYPLAWITDTFLEINDDTEYVYEEDIIKSSPNIIDVLQVGDICKKTYPTGLVEIIPINKIEDLYSIKIDIKNGFKLSIVTKEQFSSMEYKIGE